MAYFEWVSNNPVTGIIISYLLFTVGGLSLIAPWFIAHDLICKIWNLEKLQATETSPRKGEHNANPLNE